MIFPSTAVGHFRIFDQESNCIEASRIDGALDKICVHSETEHQKGKKNSIDPRVLVRTYVEEDSSHKHCV
jgi:hypothetical protein